jgi:hypothetical protein
MAPKSKKPDLTYLRERARQEDAPQTITTAQLEQEINPGKLSSDTLDRKMSQQQLLF